MDDDSFDIGGKAWKSSSSGGKRSCRHGSIAEVTSSGLSPSKSGIDYKGISINLICVCVFAVHIQMVMSVVVELGEVPMS